MDWAGWTRYPRPPAYDDNTAMHSDVPAENALSLFDTECRDIPLLRRRPDEDYFATFFDIRARCYI